MTPEFDRNLPPSVQQYRTESTQWSCKFKKRSSSPLALIEGILVSSYFFCLSSVPYLDQEEIKQRKKFPYSYSIRLAFRMPRSCHLTIFIYYLGLWSQHLKSYLLSIKDLGEKITSNIWFPHRESNPGRLEFRVFSSVKQHLNWNFQEQVRRAWSVH